MALSTIRPVRLGHFTRPPDEPLAGHKIVVVAYLVVHPSGVVLFDTGIAEADRETDERYHPVRIALDDALNAVGARIEEITAVANCHLHFDHSGNNYRFAGVPIFAQKSERNAANAPDYTFPGAVVDFAGAKFELLDGEGEILPGIRVVPTPGHVDGHQSLVVETVGGRVVLAGQAFDETSEYARAEFAWRLRRGGSDEDVHYPRWIERLQALDPVRVLFAHDLAVWDRAWSAA